MKKVLILGANPETVSLINKAREMGLFTIVTDNNPNAFAKKYADMPIDINAVDVDALEEFARRESVDGILVGVAEALLPAYCELCKRLKMPCYSTPEKFDIMVNKDLFKNKCRKYGVPTIKEYTLEDKDIIEYPVIVKPVDSCSSKGISICQNEEELKKGIEFALQFSVSNKYLIEQYMKGDEVISYYVMQDGNPIFVGMCDRYTYKQKDKVQLPTSYIFPSRHIYSYLKYSDKPVKDMIRGIGLHNGSIFFQCFVDQQGIVRTYEPGFRLNGAQEHLILSQVSGIDAKEMYINLALNGKVADENLEIKANPNHLELCCKLSPLVKTGRIESIEGLEEIIKLPDVVSINPSYNSGDIVDGYGTLKQIVCRFFIVSKTKQRLIDTINSIYSFLKVIDVEGNNMLIGRFDTSIIERYY
ncbi:MAG: ATP-grasp domain-containing protein [Lachnospiraceae bacterium]